MDWTRAKHRFAFLATAFEATGGFAPVVTWKPEAIKDDDDNVTGYLSVPWLTGDSQLVRYPRESDAKFAQRNAVAVYENHLREACERFVGYLGRKAPQREGIDAPLVKLFTEDADLRGTSLDMFWAAFSLEAKARGSLLLVVDKPQGAPANSLADQIQRRRVPYIRWATPESVVKYRIDDESGLFVSITIAGREWWDNEEIDVERDYDATSWKVRKGNSQTVLEQGNHGFGQCPVLAFTENGGVFPQIGRYAQIADLSKRLFNARSERDEILRGQTFSLLTLQVPAENAGNFDAAKVGATIGTHSMLVHSGDTPAFIAPDSGPAETYSKNIEELQASIRRISLESSSESADQPESGIARRLRFEALNSELATFARQLAQLEARVWSLFARDARSGGSVAVTWPSDFNLTDVLAELDILTMMQTTGFPPAVLNEKRRTVVSAEFDTASADVKARLAESLNELDQQGQDPGGQSQE